MICSSATVRHVESDIDRPKMSRPARAISNLLGRGCISNGMRPNMRLSSTSSGPSAKADHDQEKTKVEQQKQEKHEKLKKTQAQLDEEMQRAMAGIAGDGGEAGLELEDGKPVSMKRGVKENMFRYI